MWIGYWRHYKLKINPSDLLMLPLMMHFFVYVMPLKGGMLFQTFYSRYKYQLALSKGFSIGISVFLVSLFLTATLGLGLIFWLQIDSLILKLTLISMGFGLISLPIILSLLPKEISLTNGLLSRLIGFLINVRVQLEEQFKNRSLIIGLLGTVLLSTLIQTFWFWQTAQMLGVHSDLVSVFLVVLVLRIILLFRVLPGNAGIQELMIGIIFTSAGFSMEQGLLVALVIRLVSVFLAATIGLAGIYSNLHYFNTDSLSALISKVSKNQE
jgi:uncharacterized membrane protein YbhN (UPF0104 family)